MSGLDALLAHRRWLRRESPFPHVVSGDVLTPAAYRKIERQFIALRERGFGPPGDPHRFSQNMPHSDAYAWNFPPDLAGALALFYRRELHELLANLFGVPATGDVNGALHHHPPDTLNGVVHRDLGVGWFSRQPRPDGVNPMDLTRCSYTTGSGPATVERTEQVRALTLIFYVANPSWRPGDGGETGLYRSAADRVEAPVLEVPPINNSVLVFENTPDSYHSFIANRRTARNSVILWLHRSMADACGRYGEASVAKW